MRVGQESAEAIVVKRPCESMVERRAEGATAKRPGSLSPRQGESQRQQAEVRHHPTLREPKPPGGAATIKRCGEGKAGGSAEPEGTGQQCRRKRT